MESSVVSGNANVKCKVRHLNPFYFFYDVTQFINNFKQNDDELEDKLIINI